VVLKDSNHFNLHAEGKEAIAELLQAALADWVDFLFVPVPEVVAMYADHDEYTTFYTRDVATLKKMFSDLEECGFKAVLDYTRTL